MAYVLSPIAGAGAQFFDNYGNPLSGGLLYTYSAGTNTPAATWTTSLGTIQNPNPIVLDSAGRPPQEVWLSNAGIYKFVLNSSSGTLLWTYDNISGINSNFVAYSAQEQVVIATAGQTLVTMTTMSYIPGTNNLTVFVDGLKQIVGTNYTETSSTSITFTTGLHVGAIVDMTTATQTTTNATSATSVAYTPPFINGVVESVSAKLAQTVNVQDFGAVGDGVTDDTAAIQAAINTGLTVYAPSGKTYKTTSTITLGTNYQYIDFQGSKISPNGTFNAVTLTASNGGIKNLWIDGTNLIGNGIVATIPCQSFIIDNCIIDSCQYGISMVDNYTCWFNKFVFRYNSVGALKLTSTIVGVPVNSTWITNCTFASNSTSAYVVELAGVAGIWLNSCNFQNNTTTNVVDVGIHNGATGIRVQNCYFEDGINITGSCIYMGANTSGTSNTYGCVIENNYFQTSKQPITYGTYADESNQVINNTFVAVTGSPSFAVNKPSVNFVPIVYNNFGSLADMNRTFTPVLQFGGASTGITYSVQSGYYSRTSNTLTGVIEIQLTNKGTSTGQAVITGIPKSSNAASLGNPATTIVFTNMASLSGAVFGRNAPSGNGIYIAQQNSTGYVDLNDGNFTNTSLIELWFSITV